MIKWVKENGQEVETNDLPATIAYAESLGWKRGNSSASSESKPSKDIGAGRRKSSRTK